MENQTHLIDGQNFGEPVDWQDIEIEMDWLNKKESASVNVADLAFKGEANDYLQQRILNGLTGGVGIFEGIPYDILIGDSSNPEFTLKCYLDATEEPTIFGGEEIVLSLKKLTGDDWLNDVADSFSFASLYDEGIIKDSDFIKVPYVINNIPDGMQLIVISMSLFIMVKESIENGVALSKAIAEIINASTPSVGVGVGAGAVAVTTWDLGDFIWAGLNVLARIIYTIAMQIAINNLLKELFKQILQQKRNHLGMTFGMMMKRACQKLGLGFQSNLLLSSEFKDWVHIPAKNKKGDSGQQTGFPTNTEAIYTFGGLVRTLKQVFNADFRIKNNIFYFERKDQFNLPENYQLPEFFSNQERLLDQYTFNTDEIFANYNINWALDVQDQNTLDVVEGRIFQAITSPIAVNNQKLVNIKGLEEIQIPFSMGLEKTSLTVVEEALKALGGVVDSLTGLFGGGTNFKSQVEARIGSLLLSSHFLTTGKVVKMNGTKLANKQREQLSALNLWNKCHSINSFALYNGNHNQFKRFKELEVPMDLRDFELLLESNKGTDSSGKDFEIEKVVYNRYQRKAKIDYRIKEIYTNNLQLKIIT